MNLEVAISVYSGGQGSGCRGDNCGRKSFYHGTSSGRWKVIKKEGLRIGKHANDDQKNMNDPVFKKFFEPVPWKDRVFLTPDISIAKDYGKGGVVLKVELPEHLANQVKKHPTENGTYFLKHDVPAKYITRMR